jgi:hypothetical protein
MKDVLNRAGIAWHGFHRRLASNLNRLGVDDSGIQRILHHSNVATTQNHYIKTASPDAIAAMRQFSEALLCSACAPEEGGNPTGTVHMENNSKQPRRTKQLGGITGAGFMPGQSGNPDGRPHTKGLLTALRNKVAETGADGRTIEDQLVDVLVQEALRGKHHLPAVQAIFDRLEGRSTLRLDVNDVTADLRSRSNEELR